MNLNDIVVSERLRPLNAEWVAELERSIAAIGLRTPISIRFVDDKPTLVAGAHRLQAVKNLGWDQIPVCVFDGDERAARMWEIAENLHRAELAVLERSEQTAEWTRLVKEAKAQLAPSHPGHTGGRRDQGINAAVRELGISRTDAQRAVKIDSLAPEAKAKAVELGLDDNQSALLEAAKAETADEQVEVLKKRKERKRPTAKEQSGVQTEPIRDTDRRESAYFLPDVTDELERLTKSAELMEVSLDDVLRARALRKVGTTELCDAVKKGSVTLDGAAATLPTFPRVELRELSFDAAISQFKTWIRTLDPAQWAEVEATMQRVYAELEEPVEAEPKLQAEPAAAVAAETNPDEWTASELCGAPPSDRASQLVARLNSLPGARPKWCRERLDKPEDAIIEIKGNEGWRDASDWLTAFIVSSPAEQAAIRAAINAPITAPEPAAAAA